MKIIEEYEEIFKNNIYDEEGNYFDLINKSYKISGNIFAHFLKDKITKVIDKKYCTSVVNSYIKGSNIEWDLLILNIQPGKGGKYNVFLPENVVCALEFKTSGAIFAKDPIASKNYIEKYIAEINRINKRYKTNIKYGYISLCEIPDNLIRMKKEFHSNCFWIIEGYYKSRNKIETKDINDLKCFINNLIK